MTKHGFLYPELEHLPFPDGGACQKRGYFYRKEHQKTSHHRILLYWTCEAVLQSEVLLMHEKIDFRYGHLRSFGLS